MSSPFTGLTMAEPEQLSLREAVFESHWESPFGQGLATEQFDEDGEAVAELLDGLADEDFADALEQLLDEAAAQHLAAQAWSAGEAESHTTLTEWLEPLEAASHEALDSLAETLSGVELANLGEQHLDELLGETGETAALGHEAFDQFVGGLVRKAKKLVKGAIKGLGSLLPVKAILNKLKGLVRPLLQRVLRSAMNLLPARVRPIARTLAKKFGLGETAEEERDLAEEFDHEIVSLLWEGPQEYDFAAEDFDDEEFDAAHDRAGELDAARLRLAERLSELPPGTPPVAEIQQFVPVVMAIKPLIKMGISLIGRDKVVNFVADRIAGLIKGMVGANAARTISRPIVDVGLRALGFEVPAGEDRLLAGEALASTVEGTVLRLMEQPAETFADELALESALQQAFSESAAAFMPDQLLRADLPERETAGEGGVWVLMPRTTRPRYRYRRFTKIFMVPVSRQIARAVPWSDGGTLESYLTDRGAQDWPVAAEVSLYEAMPGTALGHLAQEEAGSASTEFQPLTPEIAGLLLHEPALGRFRGDTSGWRPSPGRRFFRVRPQGLPGRTGGRKLRRRILVGLDLPARRLRVVLRLSEAKAQQLLAKLEPGPGVGRDLPGVLTELRSGYASALPGILVTRLLRRSLAKDAATAGRIADALTTGVNTALSAFLSSRSPQLVAAARDPAQGVSITVTFTGVTRQTLGDTPPAGEVKVSAGWRARA